MCRGSTSLYLPYNILSAFVLCAAQFAPTASSHCDVRCCCYSRVLSLRGDVFYSRPSSPVDLLAFGGAWEYNSNLVVVVAFDALPGTCNHCQKGGIENLRSAVDWITNVQTIHGCLVSEKLKIDILILDIECSGLFRSRLEIEGTKMEIVVAFKVEVIVSRLTQSIFQLQLNSCAKEEGILVQRGKEVEKEVFECRLEGGHWPEAQLILKKDCMVGPDGL
jgi:hypothetical protein